MTYKIKVEESTQVLATLRSTLAVIDEFAKSNITEESFKKTIAEIRALMFKLRPFLSDPEQKNQLEELINFRIVSQRPYLEQLLMRFFALEKYGWWILGWNKKGKYVYDLDNIDLKIRGLIYKLEKTRNQ